MGRDVGRGWGKFAGRTSERVPSAFAAPVGFAVMLTAAVVCEQLRHAEPLAVALVVFAVLAGACGWLMGWAGLLFTAGFGCLVFNGFVVSGDGSLHWHGAADVARLVVLFGAALTCAVARNIYSRLHDRRDFRPVLGALRPVQAEPTSLRGERHA